MDNIELFFRHKYLEKCSMFSMNYRNNIEKWTKSIWTIKRRNNFLQTEHSALALQRSFWVFRQTERMTFAIQITCGWTDNSIIMLNLIYDTTNTQAISHIYRIHELCAVAHISIRLLVSLALASATLALIRFDRSPQTMIMNFSCVVSKSWPYK